MCSFQGRQCVLSKEDNVFFAKKTMISCQKGQCLLATEDNVFLPKKTMCSSEREQCVLSKNDDVFCSKKTMCSVQRRQCVLSTGDNHWTDKVSFPTRTMCRVQMAQTEIFSPSFGPTELIIGSSRAKNCEEVDDEVHFWLELPKPAQKDQK